MVGNQVVAAVTGGDKGVWHGRCNATLYNVTLFNGAGWCVTRSNAMLQCDLTLHNVTLLLCDTIRCDTKLCDAIQCNTLQCDTIQCNTIRCDRVKCDMMGAMWCAVWHDSVRCDTVLCSAVWHSTMWHGAMQCCVTRCGDGSPRSQYPQPIQHPLPHSLAAAKQNSQFLVEHLKWDLSAGVANLGRVTQCHQLTKIARGIYFTERIWKRGWYGEGSASVTNCHPEKKVDRLALGKHLKSIVADQSIKYQSMCQLQAAQRAPAYVKDLWQS